MIRGSFIGNLDFNKVNKTSEMLEEIVEFPGQLEKLNQTCRRMTKINIIHFI